MKIRVAQRVVTRITADLVDDPTWWACLCGNTPIQEGFYPCNALGEEVEPTPEEWTTGWYVCDSCGRIIDRTTLEVVGERRTWTPWDERESVD
jgi:hypothetical protein